MKAGRMILCFFVFLLMNHSTLSQISDALSRAWDDNHITNPVPSNARTADLKRSLDELRERGVEISEAGKSYGGRSIFQVRWGNGERRILFWSQMHGDEPTATFALLDMFAYLASKRDEEPWIRDLHDTFTLLAVPMLNPDGAEVFQRRNLQWLDINRDARKLKTPEGRVLKRVRDEFRPELGFNLHNQNELTTVGKTFSQATISLLAVSGKPDKEESYPGHERNRRICALLIGELSRYIGGHIARYDDGYNPDAFGDAIAAAGTPVILIETGALAGRNEQFLVKLNFIAYLTALRSILDESQKEADPRVYDELPFNSSDRLFNMILRNAFVRDSSNPGKIVTADIGINRERRRARFEPPYYVRAVGDLSDKKGLAEFDAENYLVVARGGLRPGIPASLLFYRNPVSTDLGASDQIPERAPDAVFRLGKWIKPLESRP